MLKTDPMITKLDVEQFLYLYVYIEYISMKLVDLFIAMKLYHPKLSELFFDVLFKM